MLTDDPNDKTPPDEPELELDETEEDEADEADETPEETETTEEVAETEEADDDADLPDDPKTLKRMIREAVLREQHATDTLRQTLRREPPTREAETDPVEALLGELEREPEKATPKVLAHILRRERQRDVAAETEREAAAALADVPEKHRAHVEAMVKKFHLPVPVAYSIYKGALYDKAVERKRARKSEAAEPAATSRTQGKAPQTRPVRRTAEPANGAGYIVVEGLKIKAKQRPGEYAALMDRLTPEQRRIVFRAKSNGKVSVE